jgi:hypothetical protein
LIADREADLAVLEQEIHRQRSTMDPADRTAQGILKALIQQQVALRGLLQSDLRPAFNDLVGELVRAIEAYNRECATRVRFEADETAAMRDLQCPGP